MDEEFNLYIHFVTQEYSDTGSIYLDVVKAPEYVENKDVDKILTLFTVLVVLVIICTAIIASAIFLSGHRPQVVWSKEKE